MPDVSDIELLRDYVQYGSEAAFAELVRRHVNLVYSAALRHVGVAAQAEEITQVVFIILAQKADRLRRDTILEAWFYQTARLTSLSLLRGERRRQWREQEAFMQSALQESDEPPHWNQLAPLLDEAMARLGQTDREAVILRFFKGKSLNEVADALKITDAAAQSRVYRAVEKLQKYFRQRGIDSTTAAITGAISANSVHTAPLALAKAATSAALAQGATAPVSTPTLAKGVLKIMAWTHTKIAIAVSAALLLVTGATITVKEIQQHHHYSWQVENPSSELLDSVSPQVTIVPTKFSPPVGTLNMGNGTIVGIQLSPNSLLGAAYQISRYHIAFQTEPPVGNYDFIANLRGGMEANRTALRQLIEKQFHLVGKKEIREADVLVMTVKTRNPPGLKRNTSGSSDIRNQSGAGYWRGFNLTSTNMAGRIEIYLKVPVVNRTDLTGRFDVELKWNEDAKGQNPDAFKEALLDQLGLELTPSHEPIEMLVVEKDR